MLKSSYIHSIQLAKVQTIVWKGKQITTGIFKEPVNDSVKVTFKGLSGDEQADLRFHGGPFKAVYCYAFEHYAFWQQKLSRLLSEGMFGENITTVGLSEEEICLGDRLRFGSALLEATGPRMPCFKLGIRFQDPTIVNMFLEENRTGTYFKVIEEGTVCVGDQINFEFKDPAQLRVHDLILLYKQQIFDFNKLKGLRQHAALDPSWLKRIDAAIHDDKR